MVVMDGDGVVDGGCCGWSRGVAGGGVFVLLLVVGGCNVKPTNIRLRLCWGYAN